MSTRNTLKTVLFQSLAVILLTHGARAAIEIGDGGPIRTPYPAAAAAAPAPMAAPIPSLILVETDFSNATVREGDTIQVKAIVEAKSAKSAESCSGTLVAVDSSQLELKSESCEAKLVAPERYELDLRFPLPKPSASRVFQLGKLMLRSGAYVRWTSGDPRKTVSVMGTLPPTLAGPVLAWVETPSGTEHVDFGQQFVLVVKLPTEERVTHAVVQYTLDRGQGPEFRVREAKASSDVGGVTLRIPFRFSAYEGSHLFLNWVGLTVSTQSLQTGDFTIPKDLPIRRSLAP